jgi:hypothetical protein
VSDQTASETVARRNPESIDAALRMYRPHSIGREITASMLVALLTLAAVVTLTVVGAIEVHAHVIDGLWHSSFDPHSRARFAYSEVRVFGWVISAGMTGMLTLEAGRLAWKHLPITAARRVKLAASREAVRLADREFGWRPRAGALHLGDTPADRYLPRIIAQGDMVVFELEHWTTIAAAPGNEWQYVGNITLDRVDPDLDDGVLMGEARDRLRAEAARRTEQAETWALESRVHEAEQQALAEVNAAMARYEQMDRDAAAQSEAEDRAIREANAQRMAALLQDQIEVEA